MSKRTLAGTASLILFAVALLAALMMILNLVNQYQTDYSAVIAFAALTFISLILAYALRRFVAR